MDYSTLFSFVTPSLVVGFVSAGILKYAPRAWKGKPMVGVAAAAAVVFSLGEQVYAIEAAHASLDLSNIGADLVLAAAVFAGSQGWFALFRKDMNLADPPAKALAQVLGDAARLADSGSKIAAAK